MTVPASRTRRRLATPIAAAGAAVLCLLAGGLAWVNAAEPPSQPAPFKLAPGFGFPSQGTWVPETVYHQRHPIVSLADRLEYETKRAKGAAPVLGEDASKRLDAFEQRMGGKGQSNVRPGRGLQHFHRDQVEQFTRRDGFGQARMDSFPPDILELEDAPAFEFADVPELNSFEDGNKATLQKKGLELASNKQRLPSLERLDGFHAEGEFNFLNPASLGLGGGKGGVSGFLSHQFRSLPELADAPPPPKTMGPHRPTERWAIRRLELVSLLKHDKPAVYVAQTLPRMQDLKKADTRPLTEFEEGALEALRSGDDLVVEAVTNRIRMVGAVRAAKQCLDCHSVQRGDLLGAFSYDLQRDPPLNTAP
jgi:hypothetical protein